MNRGTNQTGDAPAKNLRQQVILLPVIAGCFAVFFLILYFAKFAPGLSSEREAWGQFGDYIGGTLNPLFSFLGLIAIVLTYAMQARQLEMAREEVEHSREELRLTRVELERSSAAQEAAAIAVKAQAKALEEQAKYAAISAKIAALGAYGSTLSARLATLDRAILGNYLLENDLKRQLQENSQHIENLAKLISL